MNTNTLRAAAQFFHYAEVATRHGGFWVSAAGGTANVVAGELARATGVTFYEGYRALQIMGEHLLGTHWYQELADMQPPIEDFRWDVRTVARLATRKI